LAAASTWTIFSTALPSSSITSPALRVSKVGGRHLLDLLGARRHDAFERRVARLSDRGGDRDQRGRRRLNDLVTVGRLAVDLHRRAVDLDLLGERQLWKAEHLREHRRHHAGAAVVGLGRADHEVGPFLLDRSGQHARGEQGVGANQLRIGDKHATVGAHRKSLANGVLGPLGTHREQDHLAAVRLFQLQALFDPTLVAGVENDFLLAGDGVVSLEGEVGVRIWYLLDGDDDLQSVWINYRCAERAAWNRSRSAGVLRLSNCAGSRPSSHVTSRFSITS